MNNFVISLKRFFTNKTVVTVLGVLLALAILFWGYSSSIKSQTNPVNIPVAAKPINPKTKIEQEDVVFTQVASSMVGAGVIRSQYEVIGKYTNINVTIPQGSAFYESWLVEEDKLPGNWIEELNYDTGELGYYMDVNIENTLGNNVLPNTYVDIYMSAPDENGTIMFGKLLKNIKVLVVHDSSGNDVFADASSVGSPSKIGFAVSQDLYITLKKAEYLNVDLVLAPRGSKVTGKGTVEVASKTLRDHIDIQTITVEEDIIEDVKDPIEEVPNTENDSNYEEVG